MRRDTYTEDVRRRRWGTFRLVDNAHTIAFVVDDGVDPTIYEVRPVTNIREAREEIGRLNFETEALWNRAFPQLPIETP